VNTQSKLSLAVLLIACAAGPAYPQNRDIMRLNADVLDLRERVNQLQMTVDRDNGLLKNMMEKIADQMNTVTANVQKVSQAVDTIRTQNDNTSRELKAAIKTISDSVKDLEGDVSSVRAQLNSLSNSVTSLKTTSEPLAGPDDLWRSANLDLNVGNWDLAIGGLQDFLSKYPNDPRAADGQLRLGDANFALKKYDQAITQYDIVLQKYPESDKTRTALLKKGLALAETNQPQQAISILSEVAKKFPGTIEATNAQAKLKELQSVQRPRTPAK